MTFDRRIADYLKRVPRLKKALRPIALPLLPLINAAARLPVRSAAYLEQKGFLPGSYGYAFKYGGPIGRNPGDDKSILMLAISDLRIDPRIEREARSLVNSGYKVTVMFPEHDGWGEANVYWGEGVNFIPLPRSSGNFAYTYPGIFGEEFFKSASRMQPFAIHAHDLNTAHIGLAAAKHTGAHLVCDFHEWFSENVTYNSDLQRYEPHTEKQKRVYQQLERAVLRDSSAVVTVCDSIADAMASELGNGRRPTVIRNIPSINLSPTRHYPPLKNQLGIPDDQFVVLWQGGTGPSRFIEPIVAALEFAPRCVFVIRGPSLETYGEGYREVARKAGAEARLILQGPVPSRDVVTAARGADAGIWTLPRLCRNFTYALPNKIFEYTASNLALLVADYPEARRMVETHGIGLTFDPYDPRSIAAAINRLIDEPDFAKGLRANTQAALKNLDAEREWQKLVALYDALPRTGDK